MIAALTELLADEQRPFTAELLSAAITDLAPSPLHEPCQRDPLIYCCEVMGMAKEMKSLTIEEME